MSTDHATTLILTGRFDRGVRVTVDGRRVRARVIGRGLAIGLPPGDHQIGIVTNRN